MKDKREGVVKEKAVKKFRDPSKPKKTSTPKNKRIKRVLIPAIEVKHLGAKSVNMKDFKQGWDGKWHDDRGNTYTDAQFKEIRKDRGDLLNAIAGHCGHDR